MAAWRYEISLRVFLYTLCIQILRDFGGSVVKQTERDKDAKGLGSALGCDFLSF